MIFCDDEVDQGLLHAPWQLDRAGDSIVLLHIKPDGTRVLLDNLSFGPLARDTAFGRPNNRGPAVPLARSTPGQPNAGPLQPAP